jgi:cytidyltransferase-like protein
LATIIVNGVFDLLHEGHKKFLERARTVGVNPLDPGAEPNHLIVAINSDESARALKVTKWGANYPRDAQNVRAMNLREYADQVLIFDTEEQLRDIIEFAMPCVICKGPDYANVPLNLITGAHPYLARVVILDTPEPESVKQMKREIYGQSANECSLPRQA